MRRYGYQYRPRFQNDKKSANRIFRIVNLLVLLFSILVFILLVLSAVKVVRENLVQKKIISPVSSGVIASVEKVKNVFFPITLEQIITKFLKGKEGTYAVVVKNLKTNESYTLHQDKVFSSASLYKLWVMAAAYRLIEQGKLDPEKMLSSDVSDLNNKFKIATESAELTDGTVTAKVQDAISQMIVISSNYSALLLVSEIRLFSVSRFLSDFGFSHSKTGVPPVTTAADIADFYEKLYRGQLANTESTQKMLSLLKNQTLNDRIPKYLPDTLEIGHKTGELDSFKHDAGIVFAPHGDYILVVLSNTKDPQVAVENIAQISKAVFQHFEKN